MRERPEKRKIEFIESYWTGGKYGSDYVWNDNHGELIRCKNCKYWKNGYLNYDIHPWLPCMEIETHKNWFCAYAERKD